VRRFSQSTEIDGWLKKVVSRTIVMALASPAALKGHPL
jgi:hypothetical protein